MNPRIFGSITISPTVAHDRITRKAIAPAVKFLFVVSPFDAFVFRLEGFTLAYAGEMPKDHMIKITPDQFI